MIYKVPCRDMYVPTFRGWLEQTLKDILRESFKRFWKVVKFILNVY